MSSQIKNDPERVISLSQSALQNVDQTSQPRHTPLVHDISNLTSRALQDDDMSSQDNFSLCSSSHNGHGTPNDMKPWVLNDADALENAMSNKPESPEVQMLSFSFSQQLLPSTVGPSEVMYHTDFPSVQDMNDHNDLDFSHAQDFHHYSAFVDFAAFENDACAQPGTQSCTPDDAHSIGHSSHTDDSQFAWNSMMDNRNYQGSALDQLQSNIFRTVPVSPPLTEASNDVSVTSSCSNSGYPSFMSHDDAMLKDVTTPIGNQSINLGDPLFPLTPPLSEQDPNRSVPQCIKHNECPNLTYPHRTIRASKHSRRPALQTTPPQSQVKPDQEFFPPLPVREPLRQRSKESSELRNPRDHPYYSLPTNSDGKYYCPFAHGDKPCNHPPTTQKCAYQ